MSRHIIIYCLLLSLFALKVHSNKCICPQAKEIAFENGITNKVILNFEISKNCADVKCKIPLLNGISPSVLFIEGSTSNDYLYVKSFCQLFCGYGKPIDTTGTVTKLIPDTKPEGYDLKGNFDHVLHYEINETSEKDRRFTVTYAFDPFSLAPHEQWNVTPTLVHDKPLILENNSPLIKYGEAKVVTAGKPQNPLMYYGLNAVIEVPSSQIGKVYDDLEFQRSSDTYALLEIIGNKVDKVETRIADIRAHFYMGPRAPKFRAIFTRVERKLTCHCPEFSEKLGRPHFLVSEYSFNGGFDADCPIMCSYRVFTHKAPVTMVVNHNLEKNDSLSYRIFNEKNERETRTELAPGETKVILPPNKIIIVYFKSGLYPTRHRALAVKFTLDPTIDHPAFADLQ